MGVAAILMSPLKGVISLSWTDLSSFMGGLTLNIYAQTYSKLLHYFSSDSVTLAAPEVKSGLFGGLGNCRLRIRIYDVEVFRQERGQRPFLHLQREEDLCMLDARLAKIRQHHEKFGEVL